MSNAPRTPPITERLAAGPISWGVCEVPGWGIQLSPDRVLAEMRSLGIVATEAGPDGYLGTDVASARARLQRHGLALVGGFLPVVLHDPAQLDASLAKVRRTASALRGARWQVPLLCRHRRRRLVGADRPDRRAVGSPSRTRCHCSTRLPPSTASSTSYTRTGAPWSSATRTSNACSKARTWDLPRYRPSRTRRLRSARDRSGIHPTASRMCI